MTSLLRAALIFGFVAPHFGSCAHVPMAGASHFASAGVKAEPVVRPVLVKPNPEAAAIATDVALETAAAAPAPVEVEPPPPLGADLLPAPPAFACRSDQDCFWGEVCVRAMNPSEDAAGSCVLEL